MADKRADAYRNDNDASARMSLSIKPMPLADTRQVNVEPRQCLAHQRTRAVMTIMRPLIVNAKVQNCTLVNANVQNCTLVNANLQNCTLVNVKVQMAH